MKLYSSRLEARALKSITIRPSSNLSSYLMSKLTKDSFGTEIGRNCFNYIHRYMMRTGVVPSWNDLLEDPKLDESIREFLDDFNGDTFGDKEEAAKAVKKLTDYKVLRSLEAVSFEVATALKGREAVDLEELIHNIQNKINTASNNAEQASFEALHLGERSNAKKVIHNLLQGSEITYYPTGFSGFDQLNRGFSEESLVTIAGPTGGGKSLLVNQLANNMAMRGCRVAFVPLEMSTNEVLQRTIAGYTDTYMTDLLDPEKRLTSKQRAAIEKKMELHNERIEKAGGRLSYIDFSTSVTMEKLLNTLLPYEYDIYIVDYVGLVEGVDGEDQAKALSRVTAYAKNWAKRHKKVVIVAAQLSEDGLVRYSRAIREHSNYMWQWQRVDKTKPIAMVQQTKARNASDHSFELYFDFAKMSVYDYDEKAKAKEEIREFLGQKNGGNTNDPSDERMWSAITEEDIEYINSIADSAGIPRPDIKVRKGRFDAENFVKQVYSEYWAKFVDYEKDRRSKDDYSPTKIPLPRFPFRKRKPITEETKPKLLKFKKLCEKLSSYTLSSDQAYAISEKYDPRPADVKYIKDPDGNILYDDLGYPFNKNMVESITQETLDETLKQWRLDKAAEEIKRSDRANSKTNIQDDETDSDEEEDNSIQARAERRLEAEENRKKVSREAYEKRKKERQQAEAEAEERKKYQIKENAKKHLKAKQIDLM